MAFRIPVRTMATAARSSLRIGLIPADGIGREVIPVSAIFFVKTYTHVYRVIQAAKEAILALGSDVPKPEFVDLLAGFELFQKTGTALPEETVR
jgi:homoisocitrate dehydrogenase